MSSGITVSPAFQEVTLLATQSATVAEVSFINNSAESVVLDPLLGELELKTAEGLPTKEYLPKQTALSLPYAQLLTTHVELPPRQTTRLRVSIKNTDILTPGGHYFSVVVPVRKVAQTEQSKDLVPTMISTIFLTKKGGENYHLELVKASTQPLQLGSPKISLQFENTGNTHAVPYGTAIASDMFGRKSFRATINEDSLRIFPGQQQTLDVPLHAQSVVMPFSWYRIHIEGRVLPGDEQYTATLATIVVQPFALVVWIVILGTLLGVLSFKVRQYLYERQHRQFERLE